MTQSELVNPSSEVIYAITMETVLSEVSKRIGEEGMSSLTPEDIQLLREEVQSVLESEFDCRDYISQALDIWQISRSLM